MSPDAVHNIGLGVEVVTLYKSIGAHGIQEFPHFLLNPKKPIS